MSSELSKHLQRYINAFEACDMDTCGVELDFATYDSELDEAIHRWHQEHDEPLTAEDKAMVQRAIDGVTGKTAVKDGTIDWLCEHYTISAEVVQIVSVRRLNADDWTVRADCTVRNTTKHVELKIQYDRIIFSVTDFYEIGAGR